MTPSLRFTITEATVAPSGVVVSKPIGWKDIVLAQKLSEYHSKVEYFEGEFIWRGTALTLFQEIRDTVGADAKVELNVGLKTTILGGYSTLFTGLIDIFEFEEMTKYGQPYKMKCPIVNASLWTQFISRMKTPVDLMATTDLDGNACDAATKITLPLPSQAIRQTSSFESPGLNEAASDTAVSLERWSQIGLPKKLSEIEETFDLPFGLTDDSGTLVNVIKAKYSGQLTITISGKITSAASGVDITGTTAWFESKLNNDSPDVIDFGTINYSPFESSISEEFVLSGSITYNVVPNDIITIYGHWIVSVDLSASISANFGFGDDFIVTITQDTIYTDSNTESVLLKESFKNILTKITGISDPLVSDYLDNFTDNDIDFAIQKMMHLRGYSFDDKPFTLSFEKCWKGAAPLLALGFGYTDDGKFEIEKVDDFYDPTSIATLQVNDITKSYDDKFFINLLTLGFSKWQNDSAGGVDDAQTIKSWRTIFARIGKEVKNLSEFYGAALGMEQSRRNRAEFTKDFKNDEEVCVIAVKNDGGWTPELGSDFVEVTDVLNPDSRYNCRLFVSRIFKRWQRFYEACLFQTTGGKFYFVDGEGNFKAGVKFQPDDIEVSPEDSVGIAENDDFNKSFQNFIIPYKYNASGAMSYTQYNMIRTNRKKAVTIQYNGENKIVFIRDLRFKLMGGTFEGEFFEANLSNPLLNVDGTPLLNVDGTPLFNI